MKSQLMNSGAIVCSAMIIYGWAQAAVSEPDRPICDTAQSPAQSPASEDCWQPQASLDSTPEPVHNLQWGDRQASSQTLPPEMEDIYDQRLKQAQAAANQEKFTQAINQVLGIPQNSRHYPLAHRLQTDWEREVVRQATDYCQKAQMQRALTLLAVIPTDGQMADQARELQGKWQHQAGIWQQAIAAKARGDWQGVVTTLKGLEDTPLYQSLPVQDLMQQAVTQLYEPDQKLLKVAMVDLPTVSAGMAAPEAIDLPGNALFN